jgi:hypothetical protein
VQRKTQTAAYPSIPIWHGSAPTSIFFYPAETLLGADAMTAIAVAYDYSAKKFVVAADGRCSTASTPMTIKTDKQQKIFFAESRQMSIIYAMTGFSSMSDHDSGVTLFDTVTEAGRQLNSLGKRPFSDGYELSRKFCSLMAKAFENAVKGIPQVPVTPDLPPEEAGRIFRFFLLGFFRGLPFWRIASFYYDPAVSRVRTRMQDFELSHNNFAGTGSDKIRQMLYTNVPIDPRIARYRIDENTHADALERVIRYVKACSDSSAAEIDPWCQIVGGHLHAAEVTTSGFMWVIPPLTDS